MVEGAQGRGARAPARELAPSDQGACIEVIRSLPEWFGYPGALDGVRDALGCQRGFVVPGDRGEPAVFAFVTVRENFPESLEITYLAVHAAHRNRGLGTVLLATVGNLAAAAGHSVVCLLTLGPSAASPHYAETVAFYRARRFSAVRECRLTEWRGAPALLMVARPTELAALG